MLQNISTESGATPIIKFIDSTSGKINEQFTVWHKKKKKNDDNLTSVQVRFCYQMNHGTKFRKKKNHLNFHSFLD